MSQYIAGLIEADSNTSAKWVMLNCSESDDNGIFTICPKEWSKLHYLGVRYAFYFYHCFRMNVSFGDGFSNTVLAYKVHNC